MSDSIQLPDSVSKKIELGHRLDLELGCGNRKRHPDAIGIDILDYEAVDIVGDIESALPLFPDDTVDNVYTYHCFEHLKDLDGVMQNLARVLKSKGKLRIVVPHFSNPYYYSDSSHRRQFGLYTFSYFTKESLFRRQCPIYQRQIDFTLTNVNLVFKAPPPFYGRYAIKKIFQVIFNMNRYMLELYEENLCWIIPCYEICYELERL